MKKISFISMIALGAAMTACSSYDLPNPPGQTYPEPEVFDEGGIVLEQGSASVNLIDLNNANEMVDLAKVADLVNFPDTYDLAIEAEVAKDATFANAFTLPADVNGMEVTMRPDALDGAIREAITKDPATLDVYIRYAAYAVNGDTRLRLGGSDVYYGSYKYSVKPFDPETIIEDSYYLVGSFNGWDLASAVKMNHTTEGSVYDSASFAAQIEVQAGGCEWKVIPASAFAAGNLDAAYGVVDATSLSGELNAVPGRDGAGVISTAGPYLVTVDIQNMTYNVNVALDCLYVPGNGSSQTNFNKVQKLYTLDYITYQGVAQLRNNWFLTGQPKLSGIVYRSVEGSAVTENGTTSYLLVSEGGKTMKAGDLALNWVSANLVELTCSNTPLATIAAVGDHNGWNEKGDCKLTPDAKFLTWTGTFDLNAEFKLNCNDAWDIDFGGVLTAGTVPGTYTVQLTYKGSNIQVPAPGKYEITVDFSNVDIATGAYTMTLVKK